MAKIKNPIAVVQADGSVLGTKSITSNGTYNASSDSLDGYSSVTVNVPPTVFRSLVDGSITGVTADDFGTITGIKESVFAACKSLLSVVMSNTIISIGDKAFANCSNLSSVTFSSSLQEIKSEVFVNCSKLENVTFPSSLTTIGTAAFNNCGRLTNVVIPSGVTSVGNMAFYGDTKIKQIILSRNGAYTIVAHAFGGCSSLNAVIVYAETPPTLQDSNAFNNTNNCPIYVPTPDTYKATTNWVNHASRIFPLVTTVADLSNIDTTTYTKACVVGVDESYKEYTYDGSQWNEVV